MKSIIKTISKPFAKSHLYKSYLGKRTDDVGYNKFKNNYNLSHTLTSLDKKEIKQRWGSIVKSPLSWGYDFFEMAKALYGFNADFLPSSYYMPYVFELLNSPEALSLLAHKGLQKLFFRNISQPITIATCIAGILYDNDYNPINQKSLYNELQNIDFIIKPASDSSMGRGVKLVRQNDNIDLKNLVDSYKNNFIIQKIVSQSEFTKSLNPTSLNCMRITTLNLNNKISAENRIIKIGAKGQIVDNIGSGSGGMMIGLNSKGVINDFGFRVDGTKTSTKHDGQPFSKLEVPNFQNVIDFAIMCHEMIPSMGIVGWDIALDSHNNPVLIEANTYWPGITIEQLAGGAIFGDRTDEVIEYIKLELKNR